MIMEIIRLPLNLLLFILNFYLLLKVAYIIFQKPTKHLDLIYVKMLLISNQLKKLMLQQLTLNYLFYYSIPSEKIILLSHLLYDIQVFVYHSLILLNLFILCLLNEK